MFPTALIITKTKKSTIEVKHFCPLVEYGGAQL